MKFSFLTLFPTLIESYFTDSILKRAIDNGLMSVECINIRSYALDKYKKVDDPPISGGAGQVLKAEVLDRALKDLEHSHIIFLTPCGKPFKHTDARRLSQKPHISFVCGRYEGFDERVIERHANEVLSIGDFILTGGELPALMMCDSISRFIPNVLGNANSLHNESFEDNLLAPPSFAKVTHSDMFSPVPSVYLKGNHSKITSLKRHLALCKTKYFRPDLYQAYIHSEHEKRKE